MTIKALFRDMVAASMSALNVYEKTLSRNNCWLILTFHRVLPQSIRAEYPLSNLAVTPEELAWVIDSLSQYFIIKTVSEAFRCRHNGENIAPMLSITFDDGQWDNVEYALPVLAAKGVHATFYLPTDFIGNDNLLWHDRAAFAWQAVNHDPDNALSALLELNETDRKLLDISTASAFVKSLKLISPDERLRIIASLLSLSSDSHQWARMMNWDEAEQLLVAGHEIGSHGKSHNLLPQQDVGTQASELIESKAELEQHLNIKVESFCFPNGDYDQSTLASLADAGYENAVTTRWGVNDKSVERYELYRCDMNPFLMTDRNGRLSKNRLLMRVCGFKRGDGR